MYIKLACLDEIKFRSWSCRNTACCAVVVEATLTYSSCQAPVVKVYLFLNLSRDFRYSKFSIQCMSTENVFKIVRVHE